MSSAAEAGGAAEGAGEASPRSWHSAGRVLSLSRGVAHLVDAQPAGGAGAPALLFLHGFLHSAWTWRELIAPLVAAGYRVLALDLLGYGLSAEPRPGEALDLAAWREWIDEALAALGVSRLALACGNSLGGALATDLVARGACERLALINPLCAPLRLPRLPFHILGARAFRPLFRVTAGQPAFTKRALRLSAYRRMDEGILRGFEHLQRPSAHQVACSSAAHLGAISRHAAQLLPRIQAPTRCILGERDKVLGRPYQGRVEALLPPHARCLRLPDVAHCPQEIAPARVLSELLELLNEGAPPVSSPQ